jgi:hypothetical protein
VKISCRLRPVFSNCHHGGNLPALEIPMKALVAPVEAVPQEGRDEAVDGSIVELGPDRIGA